MYVDHEVLTATARLIQGAVENGLPVGDEADFAGLGERSAAIMQDLLDELEVPDLLLALRAVADRMPEPEDDSGGEG